VSNEGRHHRDENLNATRLSAYSATVSFLMRDDSSKKVVADAVVFERVSTPNSLPTGKLAGKFSNLATESAFGNANTAANAMACCKIPYPK
jgi:hypothetical protein